MKDIGMEISQERFKNEHHKLLINLIYTTNYINLQGGCLFKKYELTPEQFNVLRILRGQHPCTATVKLITERMLNKNSNSSRLVEKLRMKGLVERSECCDDRRAVNVVITSQGLELLNELDKKEEEWLKSLEGLNESEAVQLNGLLDKIRHRGSSQ